MRAQTFKEFAKGAFRVVFLGEIECNEDMLPSVINGDPLYYFNKWLGSSNTVVGFLTTTLAGQTSTTAQRSSNDALATYLQGKVTAFFTANNYSLDFGIEGIKRTANTLSNLGFFVIGTTDEGQPKVIEKRLSNHTIAFLNYTYFINAKKLDQSAIYQGSVAQEASSGLINFYDPAKVEKDIDLASKRAEYIVVGVHQSNKKGDASAFSAETTERQRSKLLTMSELGVDVVIGAHPQSFQGAKLLDGGKIVVYSLGNFLKAIAGKEFYPFSTGCVMVMEGDGFSNINYSFLPTACVKDETSGQYRVIPLFLLDGGGCTFLSKEQSQQLYKELTKIRNTLRKCGLTETTIPIQLL